MDKAIKGQSNQIMKIHCNLAHKDEFETKRFDVDHWSKGKQELMTCALLLDPRFKDQELLPEFQKRVIDGRSVVSEEGNG